MCMTRIMGMGRVSILLQVEMLEIMVRDRQSNPPPTPSQPHPWIENDRITTWRVNQSSPPKYELKLKTL